MIKIFTRIFFATFLSATCIFPATGQQINSQINPVQTPLSPVKIVNFSALDQYEKEHPVKRKRGFVGQGEDREEKAIQPKKVVAPSAVNFVAPGTSQIKREAPLQLSPAATTSFNGVLDNGTLIPPDIEGAAGPTYIIETTNQQFNIYAKSGGNPIKTISPGTLFASTGGSGYFDPHVLYDPNAGRFLLCIAGNLSNSHGAVFIAVSQTSDPTGNWYVSSFDATGNTTDFLDFPMIGYNTNWVVITGNDFYSNNTVGAKIYVLNRATLYGGSASSVSTFTDNSSFCITPAQTIDNTQTTEFLVQDWNGNPNNGNGYMNIGTITGSVSAPVYSFGNNLGINKPWSETAVNVPQSGSSHPLEVGDTRVGGNATYINGSLWFSHSVFLPASSPTHAAVDWWQINPFYPFSIQQFNRIEDVSGATFYFYPAINVNANGDALLGYCQSSSSSFASAAYSFHAATDAANTMQSGVVYKSGVAAYYKTYGGGRNRWGDFTGTGVDPSDNSFWNFNQWANSSNMWGTVIANVPASNVNTCNAPTGLSTNSITATSANFNWTAAANAVSYNIQYRIVGTSTWSTGTATNSPYNAINLAPSSNYEWQIQTVCSSGSSSFTNSATFNTPAPPCSTPGNLSTSAIGDNGATFNWDPVSGAVSYNVQYRLVGTSFWQPGTASVNSYSVTGLTAGSNYEWQVQTVCSANNSAFSASSPFSTTGTAPCNAPTNMSTTNITTTSAVFHWTGATGAVSYNVQYRINGTGSWTPGTTTATTYSATNLTSSSNYEWQVQTVCSASPSSFTASTPFTTATPPCNVPSGLSSSGVTVNGAVVSWTSTGAVSYNLQVKVTTAATWSLVSGLTATTYTLTNLAACTGYSYEVQGVCSVSNSSAYSSASTFSTTGCSITYCTSKGTSTTYEYINKVTLGTINNTSGDNKGYADFTSFSTNLTGGSSYTIGLSPGFHGSSYREYSIVYIDYNHNGVFTDAGEKVASGNSTSTLNLKFTVPKTALNGATRMRVQMEYGTAPTSSCATFTYGEVEDYTVNITGNAQAPATAMLDAAESDNSPAAISSLLLHPNPAQNNLILEYNSIQQGNAKVNIYDVLGNKVISMQYAAIEGQNRWDINTAALKDGIYIFEIDNNGDLQRQKFMISK